MNLYSKREHSNSWMIFGACGDRISENYQYSGTDSIQGIANLERFDYWDNFYQCSTVLQNWTDILWIDLRTLNFSYQHAAARKLARFSVGIIGNLVHAIQFCSTIEYILSNRIIK